MLSYLRKHAPAVRAGWAHVKAALDASNELVRSRRLERQTADEAEAGGHDEI